VGSRNEKAIAGGLLALVLALGLLAAPDDRYSENDWRLSTHRVSPNGGRALYLALEELGVKVAQGSRDWVFTDSLPPVMAVLDPSVAPAPEEVASLVEWLGRGGTLLYVAGRGMLADSLGLVLEPVLPDSVPLFGQPLWEGAAARPAGHLLAAGSEGVEGFRQAFADSSRALRSRGAERILVLEETGEAVAVRFAVGRGTVVAFADAWPFGNRRLRESGAALVFARAATEATAGGGTLVFDEYHHGYRDGGSVPAGMAKFLRESPAGHALLQLAFAGLLALLLAGRRFGAPEPAPPARRRSPLEHVEALAGAYRQAGARRTARRLLMAGAARRLGRRPPRGEQGEGELLARLAAHPTAGDAAAAARAEWQKGASADLVALSRTLDTLLDEVKRP
jgi:Domain of unknown function (DUF4350)